ncbi:MAG: hypothetical protein EA401_13000 [Planctomycetota bacterium]|nr:MAG: hypothetical protein EA401_13000 [Planctomycetota bacterium]
MVISPRFPFSIALLLGVGLWLLATPGRALEVRYGLPDPIPVAETVSGYLEVDGSLTSMPEFTVATDSHISVTLSPEQVRRHRSSTGTILLRFPLRVRIDRAVEDRDLPTITMRTEDGRMAQTPRRTITALDPLSDPQSGVRSRIHPSTIVPGQHTTLTVRFLAPYNQGWELDPDWQMALPDWALSQGGVRITSGAVRDTSGDLWSVLVARRVLTAEDSGEHAYSDVMPLRRQTRFGRRERRDAAIPATFLTVRDMGGLRAPDDDRGIVGSVEIESALTPKDIRVGEGAVLRVIVRGPQVAQLTSYPPPTIPGLRFYAVDGRSGRSEVPEERIFRWQVIPQHAGTFTVSPVSLPWLDPQTMRYHRAQTSSHTLQVTAGGRQMDVDDSQQASLSTALPDPLQRNPLLSASLLGHWIILMTGIGAGVLWRTWGVLWGINWAGHRGRRLARAWRRGDLAQVTTLAHHLLPLLPQGESADRARAAIRSIERHRYGGLNIDLDQAHRHLHCLEQFP